MITDIPPGVEYCIASVYNSREKWGKTTASGVPLNDRGLSMAHKGYKLLGWMKVTNRKTGKVIVLQVINRGPYVSKRCVDLSEGAASYLGIIGLGPVKVEECNGMACN